MGAVVVHHQVNNVSWLKERLLPDCSQEELHVFAVCRFAELVHKAAWHAIPNTAINRNTREPAAGQCHFDRLVFVHIRGRRFIPGVHRSLVHIAEVTAICN